MNKDSLDRAGSNGAYFTSNQPKSAIVNLHNKNANVNITRSNSNLEEFYLPSEGGLRKHKNDINALESKIASLMSEKVKVILIIK
jgi:hypothetical protein